MLRTTITLTLAAATALGGVGAAQAGTTSSTRAAISHAAAHNPMTQGVGAKNLAVSGIRVTKNGRFASAWVTPRNHMTDPAQVLLVKSGSRWVAKDLGTDGVGCGIVSSSTRTQLHLTGRC